MSVPKPVVLCILDGWGLREDSAANAPALARTPNFDRVMQGPHAQLVTHGNDVGLPKGQMGNSEVGHTNIGAGRVVAMDLGQIDLAIEDGSFFDKSALVDFAGTLAKSGGTAHVIGLASPGGVHSHQDHIVASVRALVDRGLPVVVHAITDGRDVAPTSAAEQIAQMHADLPDSVEIVTVSGRYYAMDRDNRWERVEKAYRAMVLGDADALSDAVEGIATCYDLDQTDEFIVPFRAENYTGMQDGDGVFFVNFRADRAREILLAIGQPDFDAFDVGARPKLAALLGMVDYSETHNAFMTTVFPKQKIVNTLGAWVAKKGMRQFRLAETEKYPHVTFFLNGGIETPEQGEDRHMAPSPKVATYDLQPEMSAGEVTEHFVKAIEDGYDLIVTNYANPDMVGHTGDLDAAIKACEAVDAGLGAVLQALEKAGGAMIVTADHGNCETMVDPKTGGPHTAHTTNPVPVALVGGPDGAQLRDGRLADLAPTILHLMGLELPPEMTGKSLIT
ncbi:2,3-bisphosphoglycerate-independent phosphoglycerate mutase [Cognatiyoonia sp. IB215182]|uniref:2,3-bisphosphoglycerate-independent phosphoglycerate mutase n=1 Tax=Cognatiyoonia sp. IB215182 TaxID=3097353 RepID=UPI002A165569|nr:2,3-bisphosphoglycerate-independent phosphoglycerate mutase [Cognatiyoonia sp. IB215182]MDX8352839.1 2,3-bisphosphoglycerate-independent phosphoglycerate mutase [Cognatiyoonia sp. IB215182]